MDSISDEFWTIGDNPQNGPFLMRNHHCTVSGEIFSPPVQPMERIGRQGFAMEVAIFAQYRKYANHGQFE
jgi:hypothetical protein